MFYKYIGNIIHSYEFHFLTIFQSYGGRETISQLQLQNKHLISDVDELAYNIMSLGNKF